MKAKKKKAKFFRSHFISHPSKEEIIENSFKMFAEYLGLEYNLSFTVGNDQVIISLEEK